MVLLSGHFQGFCRDLYSDCAQVLASHVPVAVQAVIQMQAIAELRLNSNNPTVETIRKDFERFGFTLDFAADPANGPRITHLGQLNKWRNAIAHQKTGAPTGVPPLDLAAVRGWLTSCDGLAVWLDGIMFATMHKLLGAPPW